MTTGVGLRCWLDCVAECNYDAGLWFGTQCSSFVGLCRSGHMRSAENGYWGQRKKSFVGLGNLMMVVTSLVMAVGYWSGCNPVLEQPSGSVMPRCEPLHSVLTFIGASKHTCWLGAFGGESPKPLQLLSPRDLSQLERGRPPAAAWTKLCTVKGTVYRGSYALKSSQTYPYLDLITHRKDI